MKYKVLLCLGDDSQGGIKFCSCSSVYLYVCPSICLSVHLSVAPKNYVIKSSKGIQAIDWKLCRDVISVLKMCM